MLKTSWSLATDGETQRALPGEITPRQPMELLIMGFELTAQCGRQTSVKDVVPSTDIACRDIPWDRAGEVEPIKHLRDYGVRRCKEVLAA